MAKSKDKYSPKEAKAHFEAALRGGLSTPPKPLKSMTSRRPKKKDAGAGKPQRHAT